MSSPHSSKEQLPSASTYTKPVLSSSPTAKVAPSRDQMPPFEAFGITPAEGVFEMASDGDALSAAYGHASLRAILDNGIVIGASIAACIGGLLFGFDQGLVSITLVMPQFLSVIPEVDASVTSNAGFLKGLLTAMLELGALIGALQAGFIADKISRKYTLAVGIAWFIVGSTIQTATVNYAMLVVGRTIGGIGVGVLSTTAPTYIAEISPPHLRGALLVAEEVAIVVGIVVMYFITYGTRLIESEASFRVPFAIQMAPSFILIGLLFFMPFTPRWLAQQGRDADVLSTLSRIRKLPTSDVRVQAEWLQIRAEACFCREAVLENHPTLQGTDFWSSLKLELAAWADCFRGGAARRTWIGIMIMFFQQFTGINAIVYYSPSLFAALGYGFELQLIYSGVTNVMQLVAVCSALVTLDKVGRKPPLLIGALGMAACHAISAAMIGIYEDNWPAHPVQARVGVAMLMLFMVFFGIGWGPVPWGLPSEVHSTSTRAKGVALSVASNWLNNFIIGLITPPLIQASAWGTFVFFSGFSLIAFFWTWFFCPETKGKSLEDMDRIFHSNIAVRDAKEKALILGKLTGRDTGDILANRLDNKFANRGTERRFEYA